MKRILSLAVFLSLATASLWSQAPTAPDPPKLSAEQKLTVREAQHKLDENEKQQKDLSLQFEQIQKEAQQRMAGLTQQHEALQKALDAVVKQATTGVDETKWLLDRESLNYNPAPPAEKKDKLEAKK